MLIVIEGADRTGKTYLANRLGAQLAEENSNTTVVHRSAPLNHPLEEYETSLDDYLPGGANRILDRWHWGERVWPRVFGRDTRYDEAMLRHTEMYLRSRGAVIVYATRWNLQSWHQDLVAHDEPINWNNGLPLALELYEKTIKSSYGRLGPYHWDFTRADNPGQYHKIVGAARFHEAQVEPLHALTTEWIGNPRPRTLLVGDRFGSFRQGSPNVPFAPYKGTCGHYLMQALEPSWQTTAIINATRGDGQPERIRQVWEIMGCPNVIAMGKEAQRALGRSLPDSAWDAVPHPQYWRRFQRKAGLSAYHEMFKEAGL